MPLQANDTHVHFTRKIAIASAEKADLDADDLHFYVADPGTGKRMWGWCSLDEAELSAAADDPNQTDQVKLRPDDEPPALAEVTSHDTSDGINNDTTDDDLTVEAIMSRNAERAGASAEKSALEASFEPDPILADPEPDGKPIASAIANAMAVAIPLPSPLPPETPQAGERMVILQVVGPLDCAHAAVVAQLLVLATGKVITRRDAVTFKRLADAMVD